MTKKKKGGLLSGLVGAAAVAGAAKLISDFEKKAKEDGKDILDVAKEKVGDFVEDVKSGEFAKDVSEKVDDIVEDAKSGELTKNVKEKVNDIVEDAKSGELTKNVKEKVNDIVEDVKSDEFKDNLSETLKNLKDGVVDIFDGKEESNKPEVNTEKEEA